MIQMEITLTPGAFLPFGKEMTWWRVLDVNREAETALLIAEKPVCEKAYNEKKKAVTWETCNLRQWLNGEYYDKAFSDDEKNAIIETKLHTPDNPDYGTDGGNDTNDRIFLLSAEEAEKFFENGKDRAVGQWWWLRSPGISSDIATHVSMHGGDIDDTTSEVDYKFAVRPAFYIDLRSDFFRLFNISKSPDLITMQVPSLIISENKVVGAYPGEFSIEIPEGVSEISRRCFDGNKRIGLVSVPSTLREIGAEAFIDCTNLSTICGNLGALNYGKDTFKGCNKLNYTKEMFCTTGKLCDSFMEHLDICGPEELAMILMYQKGRKWKESVRKYLNINNVNDVLSAMIMHLRKAEKIKKSLAECVAEYVRAFSSNIKPETLRTCVEVLKNGEMAAISDTLRKDPVIQAAVSENDSTYSENEERTLLDGSILFGFHTEEIVRGVDLLMGSNTPSFWRVLNVNRKENVALLIAEQPVCARGYDKKWSGVTWETCDLRKWLNEKYYEQTFSEEEKKAILETTLKNKENTKYRAPGENDTNDHIFLLSIEEADKYFRDDKDRIIGDDWWLRTVTGRGQIFQICRDGSISYRGNCVYSTPAVRPALFINLKSDYFQSLTQKNNGKVVIRTPELIIRNGAVSSANRMLKTVELPSYVKRIDSGAFCNCPELETVTWSGEDPIIEEDSFINCPKLRIAFIRSVLPASLSDSIHLMNEEEIAWILLYQTGKSWRKNGIEATKKLDPVKMFQKQLKLIRELKKLPSSVASNALDVCKEFSTILPPEYIKEFADLLEAKKCTKQLNFMQEDLTLREKLFGEEIVKSLTPIERRVKDYLDKEKLTQKGLGEKLNLMMGIKSAELPHVEDLEGNICSPNVLTWLLTAHETTETNYDGSVETVPAWKKPGIRQEALTVIELLKPDSLQAAINSLADEYLIKYQKTRKKYLAFPFCRYADEKSMSALTSRAPKWATSVSGKDAPPLLQLRSAINYSNTRAAMLFAERYQALDEYAKLRGTDADTLRNTVLSEFDLDETGKKRYELGNTVLEAMLQDDLTISLYDQGAQKIVKSVPKKNADPERYEAAKADLADIRKNIRKVAKARNNVLFEDFLTGKHYEAENWKRIHFSNPLLNRIARLLVWEQEASTFTLSAEGAIDNAGQAYTITGKPIRLAHPMEMVRADVDAWQKYYTSHGLKQPFAQVWEPVIDSKSVREDRYSGIVLPLFTFNGRDKHGIIGSGFSAYSEDFEVRFKDCDLELTPSTWRLDSGGYDGYTYTLGKFSYKDYTRYTNHIVGILDGWTVEQRILKDDVSVVDRLDSFTLAQITEFIKKASEHNCNNVTAALLEYKNKRFAGYDPMEHFWLEDF